MRKIIATIMIIMFALAVFAGCGQTQKDKPKNGKTTGRGEAGDLEYMKTVTVHYSDKEEPKETDIIALKDKRAPEDVKVIVAQFPKFEKAPEGREVEAMILKKGGNQVLASETFKSEILRGKQIQLKLFRDSDQFEPGEYILMIREKHGRDTVEKAFVIGNPDEDYKKNVKDKSEKEDAKKNDTKDDAGKNDIKTKEKDEDNKGKEKPDNNEADETTTPGYEEKIDADKADMKKIEARKGDYKEKKMEDTGDEKYNMKNIEKKDTDEDNMKKVEKSGNPEYGNKKIEDKDGGKYNMKTIEKK